METLGLPRFPEGDPGRWAGWARAWAEWNPMLRMEASKGTGWVQEGIRDFGTSQNLPGLVA
jgi:hypothetical protein